MAVVIFGQSLSALNIVIIEYLALLMLYLRPGLAVTNTNCTAEVTQTFNNCTEKEYWNFKFIGDKKSDIGTFYCGNKHVIGCLNATKTFRSQECNEEKTLHGGVPSIGKRKDLLISLCTTVENTGKKCLQILSDANNLLRNSNQNHQFKFSTNVIKPIGCCLHMIQNSYNLSKTSLKKISEVLVKQEKKALDQICLLNIQPTLETGQNSVHDSSKRTMLPVTSETTVKPNSKGILKSTSGRLVAGLVIATIIFIIVTFIIARFMYQRFQRKKRAKYEDYGYSQLKVILDDALDEEDDDDQLLSVT